MHLCRLGAIHWERVGRKSKIIIENSWKTAKWNPQAKTFKQYMRSTRPWVQDICLQKEVEKNSTVLSYSSFHISVLLKGMVVGKSMKKKVIDHTYITLITLSARNERWSLFVLIRWNQIETLFILTDWSFLFVQSFSFFAFSCFVLLDDELINERYDKCFWRAFLIDLRYLCRVITKMMKI